MCDHFTTLRSKGLTIIGVEAVVHYLDFYL